MVSLPKDASYWQQQLFSLDEPVTLPKDLFEQVWPLVSSVYTFRNKRLQQRGTIEVEHGECRLKKSRKSSMAKPGNAMKVVSRSWVEEIRAAVAPLENSQPREIFETSSLGVVEIVFFFICCIYKTHWHLNDIFIF